MALVLGETPAVDAQARAGRWGSLIRAPIEPTPCCDASREVGQASNRSFVGSWWRAIRVCPNFGPGQGMSRETAARSSPSSSSALARLGEPTQPGSHPTLRRRPNPRVRARHGCRPGQLNVGAVGRRAPPGASAGLRGRRSARAAHRYHVCEGRPSLRPRPRHLRCPRPAQCGAANSYGRRSEQRTGDASQAVWRARGGRREAWLGSGQHAESLRRSRGTGRQRRSGFRASIVSGTGPSSSTSSTIDSGSQSVTSGSIS